jgi:hypothetical protein
MTMLHLLFDWRLHAAGIALASLILWGAMRKVPPHGVKQWVFVILTALIWPAPIGLFIAGMVEAEVEAQRRRKARRNVRIARAEVGRGPKATGNCPNVQDDTQ